MSGEAMRPSACRRSGAARAPSTTIRCRPAAVRSQRRSLPASPPLPAGEERLRLFDHIARFLQALAAPAGLLVFLDDLHWSDQGTLSLLHYLLRRLRHGEEVVRTGSEGEEEGGGEEEELGVERGHGLKYFKFLVFYTMINPLTKTIKK